MATLVQLTQRVGTTESPVWVNLDRILLMRRLTWEDGTGRTEVNLTDGSLYVTETPEHIAHAAYAEHPLASRS